MSRFAFLFGALLVVATMLLGGTRAADAATQVATPIVPNPTECAVAPRSLDDLRALATSALATPAASPPSDVVDQAPSSPPPGVPADAETVAAVTAVVEEALACQNAGAYLAIFTLQTDEFIRLQYSSLREPIENLGGVEAVLAPYATPIGDVPRDLWGGYFAVRDVQVLPDERILAIVDYAVPQGDGSFGSRADYLVFRLVDGRYLIDGTAIDIDDVVIEGATPVP